MSTTGKPKRSSGKGDTVQRPFASGVMHAARELAARYTYFVRYEAEDDCFVARPVELPHQIGAGETAEEAMVAARELTTSSVASMMESGDAPPPPGAPDIPRTQQINFRVTVQEKARMEAVAQRAGLSLVDYVRSASLSSQVLPPQVGRVDVRQPHGLAIVPCKQVTFLDGPGQWNIVGTIDSTVPTPEVRRIGVYVAIGRGDEETGEFHLAMYAPDQTSLFTARLRVTQWGLSGLAEFGFDGIPVSFGQPGRYVFRVSEGERTLLERHVLAAPKPEERDE